MRIILVNDVKPITDANFHSKTHCTCATVITTVYTCRVSCASWYSAK